MLNNIIDYLKDVQTEWGKLINEGACQLVHPFACPTLFYATIKILNNCPTVSRVSKNSAVYVLFLKCFVTFKDIMWPFTTWSTQFAFIAFSFVILLFKLHNCSCVLTSCCSAPSRQHDSLENVFSSSFVELLSSCVTVIGLVWEVMSLSKSVFTYHSDLYYTWTKIAGGLGDGHAMRPRPSALPLLLRLRDLKWASKVGGFVFLMAVYGDALLSMPEITI